MHKSLNLKWKSSVSFLAQAQLGSQPRHLPEQRTETQRLPGTPWGMKSPPGPGQGGGQALTPLCLPRRFLPGISRAFLPPPGWCRSQNTSPGCQPAVFGGRAPLGACRRTAGPRGSAEEETPLRGESWGHPAGKNQLTDSANSGFWGNRPAWPVADADRVSGGSLVGGNPFFLS